MSIVIVDYHKGNLLSVERGLVGAGADVVVTDEADVIRAADAVVLPGVGAFADAAASMEEMGQMEAVRAAVAGGAAVTVAGLFLGGFILQQERWFIWIVSAVLLGIFAVLLPLILTAAGRRRRIRIERARTEEASV